MRLRVFCSCVAGLWLAGCAGTGDQRLWGEDATATPGWNRVGQAALKAAGDPLTWAPALGAAGLQIGNADEEIAEWANEETPVFGSRETAKDASDWLRAASWALYAAAGLSAPASPNEPAKTKTRGFAVGVAAILATDGMTNLFKDTVDRTRPLGQDTESFPSGHTSSTVVSARLTHDALRYHGMPRGARIASDIGLAGLAAMTGWARIEGGRHHPADVLAGAALGNFIAVFATEAFLAPVAGRDAQLRLDTAGKGMVLRFDLRF